MNSMIASSPTVQVLEDLRILHLPDVVGGHPVALSQGERELGYASDTYSLVRSPYGYSADILAKHQNGSRFVAWIERLTNFLHLRSRYDVFHFNYGSSLLNSANGRLLLADLPYYPANAKKVMTFQGSDARGSYEPVLEDSIEIERRIGSPYLAHELMLCDPDQRRAIRLATIDKAAKNCDTLLALNPDLLQHLPAGSAAFFPYAIAPLDVIEPVAGSNERPLHFVHVSTNRILKGTGLIEAVLKEARETLGITYSIVVKQPRDLALQEMKNADVFIDQMVLGWYGAAAVEAMYMGKPVIGYISERQQSLAPSSLAVELPIIKASHKQLYSTIAALVSNRDSLLERGRAGRNFAVNRHHPQVAARAALLHYQR
jgi:hypothetical protein